MVGEEISIFKDYSPVIALIIIMVTGGKWILQKSWEQSEVSRKESFEQITIARKNFTDYIEKTGKEHTEAMNRMSENISSLSLNLENHTKTKEDFIDTIGDQRKTINELFEMLKEQLKTNR